MANVSKVWGAWDVNDDGHPTNLLGYFTNEADAKVAAMGRGWGGMGKVIAAPTLMVDGEEYLLANPNPIQVDPDISAHIKAMREKAIAKLTDAERILLGVTQA